MHKTATRTPQLMGMPSAADALLVLVATVLKLLVVGSCVVDRHGGLLGVGIMPPPLHLERTAAAIADVPARPETDERYERRGYEPEHQKHARQTEARVAARCMCLLLRRRSTS